MKLTAAREDLLTPLQSVIGVVERRQTMPVLANVLLAARDNRLSITGTDLEVELVATSGVTVQQAGDITVPGRKLFDCQTGFSLQQTSDARLPDRVGNALAEFGSEALNVGHLDQAELAVTEVGDEIADKDVLVAASCGGSNSDLALEPSDGRILEPSAAFVYQPVCHFSYAIRQ